MAENEITVQVDDDAKETGDTGIDFEHERLCAWIKAVQDTETPEETEARETKERAAKNRERIKGQAERAVEGNSAEAIAFADQHHANLDYLKAVERAEKRREKGERQGVLDHIAKLREIAEAG